jgi:tetratricopeptide (TPR) repeat protein
MKFRLSLALLGLTTLVVGVSSPVLALSLEEQLDIQPYNATAGPARDVADQWLHLGNQQLAEGDYRQAIASWQEAASLYQVLRDNRAAGLAYSAIGSTYARLGRYPEAERAIRLRIAAARDNQDLIGASYGLNNLGTLYLNQAQLEQAQVLFEQALELAKAAEDHRALGLSLSNLGLVATQKDDLNAAVELLEAATNYRYLARDYLGEANSSNSLGDVYVALGRQSNAVGAYRVALRSGVDAADRALQLRALDGLLRIYFDRSDWAAVQRYLNQRRDLTLGSIEPDLQTVVTLQWLGDYHYAQGDAQKAEELYGKALGLARVLDNSMLEAELVNRLLSL